MPTRQQVFWNNLGADFRKVANKIVNDNFVGGLTTTPAGAPAEPSKAWLYINQTFQKVTHYWNPPTSAWVALADPYLVKEVYATVAGPTVLPPPSVAGNIITAQTLIEVTAATTVTLPTIPAAIAAELVGVEWDIKTTGTWAGTVTVLPPAGQTIDALPTLTFNKSTSQRPSRSLRYNGANRWLVV